MKEVSTSSRSGRRRSPDLGKKKRKLNSVVETLQRNLDPKVKIPRCDDSEKMARGMSQSPDKSPRSRRKTLREEAEDSESEPLSRLLSSGAKGADKSPVSLAPALDVGEPKVSKVIVDKSKKMPNKGATEDKRLEEVKKADKVVKVTKKDEKVNTGSEKSVRVNERPEQAKKSDGDSKVQKVAKSQCKDGPKKTDSGSDAEIGTARSPPVSAKQASVKKLLESTIRNRMNKRLVDDEDELPRHSLEPKKRKVGRPPKIRPDGETPNKTNKIDTATEKAGKAPKKLGRKKKNSVEDGSGPKQPPESPIDDPDSSKKEVKGPQEQTSATANEEKVKPKKVAFSKKKETKTGERENETTNEQDSKKEDIEKENSGSDNETLRSRKMKEKKKMKESGKKKIVSKKVVKDEKTDGSDSEVETPKKKTKPIKKAKEDKTDNSESEPENTKKKPKNGRKGRKTSESSDSEPDEKAKKASKVKSKKIVETSDSEDDPETSKKTDSKPKKRIRMPKKVVKLRARFKRKRIASLNARAKVTCMFDENEEPIDLNHFVELLPVIVGDDVILRKKKKKGLLFRKPRKQKQPEVPPLKDLIVSKRMASLNATAMMAASTDLDRRRKEDDGIKSPVLRKEEQNEHSLKKEDNDAKKGTDKTPKTETNKKGNKKGEEGAKKGEEVKPDLDVYEFQCDEKPAKMTKKKCDTEKKNKEMPLKKRKRVEAKNTPVTSPLSQAEVKEERLSPVKAPPPAPQSQKEVKSTPQGVLDLRSPQPLTIPPAVDALLKNSDAVTISGVYIDARCSSQSSSHSYVISGSMQAYNYSVATRTEERRGATPPPAQPTVAKVRPYNPLGALCGMRIPDQSQTHCPPPCDGQWHPHDPQAAPSQPGEHGHSSAFQAPSHQPPHGWYQPAGPLIHTPYKPPERQPSPQPSTSRPASSTQEKKEEPPVQPEKPPTPPPPVEWHSPPHDRGFHHYYPPYPPAPYPFYHYPTLPPTSTAQSRDGYSGYPGPPLPHPHPVYPYQGTSYYPPPPPTHQGYTGYDPYDPYRQSTSSLVQPPVGSPSSSYPVRPAPHLARPTVLPAPTPYYPPYYGCHQPSGPVPPTHYDPRHMRCSCPSRSPTCPKNVQPGPLTGEGVGSGYHTENPHAPLPQGARALGSPASGSVPRSMESQTPGSGAKVVDSEVAAPITKKYLSAKEMKKLLKSIDLETCRKVWKEKKAERKRQKMQRRKMSLGSVTEYSSGTDDFQDNIPLKLLAREIKLERVDEFDSELTTSSSCDSNLVTVKTECIKIEDPTPTPSMAEEPAKDQPIETAPEPPQPIKPTSESNGPVTVEGSPIRKKRRKKRLIKAKKLMEHRIRKKRGRKPKKVVTPPPKSTTSIKRTASGSGRSSILRTGSRSGEKTPGETVLEEKSIADKKERLACGWSWYGEPFEAKVYLSNDDPPVLRRCYPSMRHEEGEIIRLRDSVILRSGTRANDLPYVAKVAAMWDNPDDGEMMISILWFYRPEHTERGRKSGDKGDEVFASRHRDTTYVACIEDKCHVLTYNEYCRYRAMTTRIDEGGWPPMNPPVVPPLPKDCLDAWSNSHFSRIDRIPTIKMEADRVFLCRKVYDYRQKRILKNPA